jgi:hypothetical protein
MEDCKQHEEWKRKTAKNNSKAATCKASRSNSKSWGTSGSHEAMTARQDELECLMQPEPETGERLAT